MAKLDKLMSVNLTIVYPELDIRFIDEGGFRKFPELEEDAYGSTFSISEDVIQLILPQRKVSIIINGKTNKAIISDDYVQDPCSRSDLVNKYAISVLEQLKRFNNFAYGFNYNLRVSVGDSNKNFLSAKIMKQCDDKEFVSEGIKLIYRKENVKYTAIVENENTNIYQVMFNIERQFDINSIKDKYNTIDDQFKLGYEEVKNFVRSL